MTNKSMYVLVCLCVGGIAKNATLKASIVVDN